MNWTAFLTVVGLGSMFAVPGQFPIYGRKRPRVGWSLFACAVLCIASAIGLGVHRP